MKNSPAMLDVFALVARERARQRDLYRTGRISFDCGSPIPDLNRKLRVLVEEVGEVAQDIDRLEDSRDARGRKFILEDLEKELVQVAAVAVAWLESLQPKSQNEKSR
jgi:hypothetical protein